MKGIQSIFCLSILSMQYESLHANIYLLIRIYAYVFFIFAGYILFHSFLFTLNNLEGNSVIFKYISFTERDLLSLLKVLVRFGWSLSNCYVVSCKNGFMFCFCFSHESGNIHF